MPRDGTAAASEGRDARAIRHPWLPLDQHRGIGIQTIEAAPRDAAPVGRKSAENEAGCIRQQLARGNDALTPGKRRNGRYVNNQRDDAEGCGKDAANSLVRNMLDEQCSFFVKDLFSF